MYTLHSSAHAWSVWVRHAWDHLLRTGTLMTHTNQEAASLVLASQRLAKHLPLQIARDEVRSEFTDSQGRLRWRPPPPSAPNAPSAPSVTMSKWMTGSTRLRATLTALAATTALLLAGCASRPVNPRLETIDLAAGYRDTNRTRTKSLDDTEIIITFSGGGTRAAAFSFGVLEELRRQQLQVRGRSVRLLDEVGLISGVSGGSFTALSYGLYGERLFDEYPRRFLERNVQAEIIKRALTPANWAKLWSTGVGRSELAADYYDEILFEGATFGTLAQRPGPLVVAGSTDISTGARLSFSQSDFDVICSDLAGVRLSRAAAASSAVPVVLSPLTFNNYGGTCGYDRPLWARALEERKSAISGRLHQRYAELRSFQDSTRRPFLHLVDGGVADNLGLRPVLERFRAAEASPDFHKSLNIDKLRRTLLIIVNSRSDPELGWDRSEDGPSAVSLLLKSINVPIDRNSFEAVELMKDLLERWKQAREGAQPGAQEQPTGPQRIRLYPVVVSFDAVDESEMRARLMALPTSFYLPSSDVDLLRAVAGELLRNSPEFQAFINDLREQ